MNVCKHQRHKRFPMDIICIVSIAKASEGANLRSVEDLVPTLGM